MNIHFNFDWGCNFWTKHLEHIELFTVSIKYTNLYQNYQLSDATTGRDQLVVTFGLTPLEIKRQDDTIENNIQ